MFMKRSGIGNGVLRRAAATTGAATLVAAFSARAGGMPLDTIIGNSRQLSPCGNMPAAVPKAIWISLAARFSALSSSERGLPVTEKISRTSSGPQVAAMTRC